MTDEYKLPSDEEVRHKLDEEYPAPEDEAVLNAALQTQIDSLNKVFRRMYRDEPTPMNIVMGLGHLVGQFCVNMATTYSRDDLPGDDHMLEMGKTFSKDELLGGVFSMVLQHAMEIIEPDNGDVHIHVKIGGQAAARSPFTKGIRKPYMPKVRSRARR